MPRPSLRETRHGCKGSSGHRSWKLEGDGNGGVGSNSAALRCEHLTFKSPSSCLWPVSTVLVPQATAGLSSRQLPLQREQGQALSLRETVYGDETALTLGTTALVLMLNVSNGD